jgi:hypothetical protein
MDAPAPAAVPSAPIVQESEPAAAAPVEVKPFLRGTFFRDVASNSLGALLRAGEKEAPLRL